MSTASISRGRWLITIVATITLVAALLLTGPARTLAQDEATPGATPDTTTTAETAGEAGVTEAPANQPATGEETVTAAEVTQDTPAPTFSAGDGARVADGPLNLRAAAGLDADVILALAIGVPLQVIGGPAESDGYTWYEVRTTAGDEGWVAGEFLEASGAASFAAGDTLVVIDGPLNVRAEATLEGEVIDQLPTAEFADVLAGPTSADDYTWYQVESEGGVTGWVAGEFLGREDDQPASGDDGGDTGGSADFAIGDAARATVEDLNFRAAAGLDAEVLDTVDLDALFVIRDGPVSADGYTWYLVFNYYYGEGWVAGELLTLEPDGFPGEEGA